MDFASGGTAFRGDLNAFVLEAAQADDMFIADQLSPAIPVMLQQGQYPKLRQGGYQLLSLSNEPRAPGAQYPERQAAIDRDTFDCVDRGLVGVVDQSIQAYFGRYNLNLEAQEAQTVTRNIRMGTEKLTADLYFNSSNWTTTNVVSSYLTANIATVANPIIDIQSAITTIAANGWKADTVVMSMNVYNYMTRTGNFQNFYKPYGVGNAGQIADLNAIKKAFEGWGIDKVFASYLNYNTSNSLTAAPSLSPIWSNSYIWVGKRGTGSLAGGAGGAGGTFFWQQRGALYNTESWYDIDRDATKIRVRSYLVPKIFDSTAGILINTGYTGG